MATATLRPNATTRAGTSSTQPSGSQVHAVLSDVDNNTYVLVTSFGTDLGTSNTDPGSNYPKLAIADITGVMPAGRKIRRVRGAITADASNGEMEGINYGQVAFRFSDNTHFQTVKPATPSLNNFLIAQTAFGAWATTGKGGAAWDAAMVDGMVAYIGAVYGASGGPSPVEEVWLEVEYYDLPAAPTAVTPANGATVTVRNPVLGATMAAIATAQTQRAEWQFATDNAFTTNVITITESSSDNRASGATTESPTVAQLNLANGTWYFRARAIDQYGYYGPYSATQSFTVSVPNPPTPTAVTPANASTVTTMTPTLGATLGVDSAGRTQKAEWQIATDSGFTANVKTITEADTDLRASGATTEVVPAAKKLTLNGTYYLRARSIANDGTPSAWTAGQSFTLALTDPPAPTGVTPVNGATIATNRPVVGATLGAASEGRRVLAQWQFATDSGFTTNNRVFTGTTLVTSGTVSEQIDAATALTQTTWFFKARAVDEYGNAGPWSATQSFIVSHAPTTSGHSPTGDSTVQYSATTNFSWAFSDPAGASDSQRAYQIIIERNDTNALVLDTGKVISGVQSVALAIPVGQKDHPLRWKIQVWDQDDVTAGYSNYHLFNVSDPPVITITSPTAGQQVGSGRPQVVWTLDQANQKNFRVKFVRTSDNVVVHDSGVVTSTAGSYQPPYTVLDNLVAYRVDVTITDTANLSSTASQNFSTLYTAPPSVTYSVDDSFYATNGYVLVDWSTMEPDAYFVAWHVYRRLEGETAWELVANYPASNVRQYKDYLALSGESYEYAVTQVADRSGLTFESVQNPTPTAITPVSDNYWLINPKDVEQTIMLLNVNQDDYTDEIESTTYTVIGRGRRVDYGTTLGKAGSISAKLRDNPVRSARQQKTDLENIRKSRSSYYMRDPFGNILLVSLGDISVSRIAGVGTSEFVDVSFSYTEVF